MIILLKLAAKVANFHSDFGILQNLNKIKVIKSFKKRSAPKLKMPTSFHHADVPIKYIGRLIWFLKFVFVRRDFDEAVFYPIREKIILPIPTTKITKKEVIPNDSQDFFFLSSVKIREITIEIKNVFKMKESTSSELWVATKFIPVRIINKTKQ